MTRVPLTAPDRPAASANGTVNPSDIPMTISRTKSEAVKCFSRCGVCGMSLEVFSSVRILVRRNLFGLAYGDDMASTFPAFPAQPYYPVRASNDIQVVLDDQDAAAVVNKTPKGVE